MTGNIDGIKTLLESSTGQKADMFDFNKFLPISTFNDFVKAHGKDNEKLQRELDDFNRLMSSVQMSLNEKASQDDLRNFETIFGSKLEETKIFFSRRYPDKLDVNKTFKYLETQIKQLIEMCSKKSEKADSWLISVII